jgi:hypothetical protein
MQVCMQCHTDAMTTCSRCHVHDARGLLATELPDGRRLVPTAWWGAAAHVGEFETEHGMAAAADETLCRSCHEEVFCQSCHLGLATERRFHGAGWLTLHGPAARSSDLRCTTCHDSQNTCLACHRRAAASPAEASDMFPPAGASHYHPAGWSYDPAGHPREARRNLGSCVACHSERDCFACHAGVSPHGDSWEERCESIRSSAGGVCLECHATVPDCD